MGQGRTDIQTNGYPDIVKYDFRYTKDATKLLEKLHSQ